MFAIGFRMVRDKFKSLLIFTLAAVGFVEMYVALFPAIKQQAAMIDEMMKTFPVEFFKAMNMDAESLSFNSLESYMSTEYMSFLWPILAIIFAISLANHIAIREIDKGTIETLCSLPVSRLKIFLSRYAAGAKMLGIFSIISLLAVVPFAMLHGIDFKIMNYIVAAIGSMFFILAIYSLATLISVIVSEKSKSTMIASSVILVMYVLNVVANLNENLTNLQYVSFFHYFNTTELLNKGIFSENMFIVFGGVILVTTIAAAIRFKRRDLSV